MLHQKSVLAAVQPLQARKRLSALKRLPGATKQNHRDTEVSGGFS